MDCIGFFANQNCIGTVVSIFNVELLNHAKSLQLHLVCVSVFVHGTSCVAWRYILDNGPKKVRAIHPVTAGGMDSNTFSVKDGEGVKCCEFASI